jgi:isochorismate hydrolase
MNESRALKLGCRYYRWYPPEKNLGYAEEELALGLDNTVLLIVDVYGVGYDDDHEFGDVPEIYKRDVNLVRDIVRDFIKPTKIAAKKAGLPVIYLTNHLDSSTTETNELRNMALRTYGVDILEVWKEPTDVLAFSETIAPEEDDFLIKKQHHSGFYETTLESLLKELGALRDCIGSLEYPETEEEGWVNWYAVRFIESNVGYTSTASAFIRACESASRGGES